LNASDKVAIAEARAKEADAKARAEHSKAAAQIVKAKSQAIAKFMNSGYSESGASHSKKSLRGWRAISSSPQEDIDQNLDTLRERSRDLYMSAPLATSAIKTQRTNVIGSGLKLKSGIDFRYLGLTKEEADTWEINTEREFDLWADSIWCDMQRLNNFYELQQLAMMSWLMNGDCFVLPRFTEIKKWMPYSLRLYLIEADRCSNPNSANTLGIYAKADNGNRIVSGVEIDSEGGVAAYYFCNKYPEDYSVGSGIKKEWQRVAAYGEETGRPNVLHLMESERCEQYRGVPYLAPVIEVLKQISRYTEAELTAAVIESFFTAFITTEANTENPFGDTIPEEERVDDIDPDSYEMGAGTINVLAPGEQVTFGDPKRPASGFDGFISTMTRILGAALEVPEELLTKSFKESYSASRAGLLEAWKAFRMRRTWFANDFCKPIYELWLIEAVANGRVKAPGFFNDPAIMKAWCRSTWNGPAPGQLDPGKEVDAAIKRVQQAFSTREAETAELTGGNWDENVAQVIRENQLLNEAQPPQNTAE
jgi:lambda family phage portal protein